MLALLLSGLLLMVCVVPLGTWFRREGDPIRFELIVRGEVFEAPNVAAASYVPERLIPFVTQDFRLLGGSQARLYETSPRVVSSGARFEITLPSRMLSFRDERLRSLRIGAQYGVISFGVVPNGPPSELPEDISSGYENGYEYAVREGNVARIERHAAFYPSTISIASADFDAIDTVQAIVDVSPITITRLAVGSRAALGWSDYTHVPSGATAGGNVLTVPSGHEVPLPIDVGVTRAGLAAARAPRDDAGGAIVEAVAVPRDAYREVLRWRTVSSPFIEITRAEWAALRARADARWGLAIDRIEDHDVVRLNVGPGALGALVVIVVGFRPGETVASGDAIAVRVDR